MHIHTISRAIENSKTQMKTSKNVIHRELNHAAIKKNNRNTEGDVQNDLVAPLSGYCVPLIAETNNKLYLMYSGIARQVSGCCYPCKLRKQL